MFLYNSVAQLMANGQQHLWYFPLARVTMALAMKQMLNIMAQNAIFSVVQCLSEVVQMFEVSTTWAETGLCWQGEYKGIHADSFFLYLNKNGYELTRNFNLTEVPTDLVLF